MGLHLQTEVVKALGKVGSKEDGNLITEIDALFLKLLLIFSLITDKTETFCSIN